MSAKPPGRKAPHTKPVEDRSAAAASKDKHGSLRWVRNVLGRSIGLEQRRGPGAGDSPSLVLQQRAELGARLLVHDPATQAVRHLVVVHDALGGGSWAGVAALPPQVTGRALAEAEMLASQEPSALLATVIERLRELTAAADTRAEHGVSRRDWAKPEIPEVSESTHEEYELMERSWMGTVPSGLELPDRGA